MMRWKSVFFIVIVAMIQMFFSYPPVLAKEKSHSLERVKNYNIYYGGPTPRMMDEADYFDLLILEPRNFTTNELRQIKNKGVLIFGYISPTETAEWMKDIVPKLRSGDYATKNKKRIKVNKQINLMDISSKHYQDILMDAIKRHIVDMGFDGIYLDAMGDIEYWFKDTPQKMKKQKQAMAQFLKRVKTKYPSLKLIQGGGSDLLQEYTSTIVDAFFWENLPYDWAIRSEDAQQRIRMLQNLMKKRDFIVLSLVPNEPDDQKSYHYSLQKGFIPLLSVCDGGEWVIPPTVES